MKKTKIIMGMPVTVEVVDTVSGGDLNSVFEYFKSVDERFSTYKTTSEISKINKGLPKKQWSQQMKAVLDLCEETKKLTKGYFDIDYQGKLDPSGLVKGWAIYNAAQMLLDKGLKNFYIEAGGDIQAQGMNLDGQPWAVGIRNPFVVHEIIKVVRLKNQGMATSGTYIRGQHIYNPHVAGHPMYSVKSLSVIASNVYEADRYATAAFAMGERGIGFIEETPGLEGYVVNSEKVATYTSGFEGYVDTDA
jgi:thiamine biosynthesis lipoprotein